MDNRIIDQNYHVMIEALYNFGARTSQLSNDIMEAVNTCRNALGQEDSSIASISAQAVRTQSHYNQVALRALKIAKAMAEELKMGELERMIWEYEH